MSSFSPSRRRISILGAAAVCAAIFGMSMGSPLGAQKAAPAVSAPSASVSTPPTYRKEFGTMWTFDAPPIEYWKQTYGFTATPEWLENVRLSSVRLPGCSASFVSSQGLVMTNHHCARECTAAVSPKDTNYMETGFAAATLAEEKKCPGLYVDQLQSFEDVTGRVQAAVTGKTDSAQAAQRATAVKTIEDECKTATGMNCQVVTLYNGGRYSLYRYKRYSDVRLVMAPEEAAAFFGGDPDNFTFPRYDLDLTLLRVYDNDAPFKPSHYFRWSPKGAVADELIFVTGNPGSTERLSTVAQLEFNRDVGYPIRLREYVRNLTYLRSLIAKNPSLQREYQNDIFGLENSYKAVSGFHRGLLDSTLMARKRAFEAEVRARINADPKLKAEFGKSWDEIAAATKKMTAVYPALSYHFGGRSSYFTAARQLVAAARKPGNPQYTRVREALAKPQPFDTADTDALEQSVVLTLRDAQAALPATDPYIKLVFNGQTPEAAARRLVRDSKFRSADFRKSILDGGAAAVESSTDPLIALVRHAEATDDPLRKQFNEADAVVKAQSAMIGRALYAVYGTILPPDATFTLRITDGVVKGYPMNGTVAPYKTSFYGLYARSAEFDNKAPFELPARWVAAREKLDMSTPYDFVSTNDIIGGNSGSPVINRNAEIVGLIFDGNIESLPNRFVFTDDVARSVSVHSQAITEALRKVYNATRIADELEGKSAK